TVDFSLQTIGPYVVFKDLCLGVKEQHVVGRMLKFWIIRDETNHEDFKGISFLLLAEKNTTIHCFIPQKLVEQFYADLREGKIFQILNFEVQGCTKHHKVTNHLLVINFIDNTSLVDVNNTWLSIAKYKFRIKSPEHLLAFANTNIALPDVVGEITTVEGTNLHNSTSTDRVLVRLNLLPNVTISLSLWGDTASRFRGLLNTSSEVKSVALVTVFNPTLLEGMTTFIYNSV
ncbi:hypothetical protein EUTSA_v10015887mg, partial [Eutrema salsugineum]